MTTKQKPLPQNIFERGISTDGEMAGPEILTYSLLSIGACLISDVQEKFYVELKPDIDHYCPNAMSVNKLGFERLKDEGVDPKQAITMFAEWSREVIDSQYDPLFVAYNVGFDWMFIQLCASKYGVRLPFGHKGFCSWSRFGKMNPLIYVLPHHALDDAIIQRHFFVDTAKECGLL